MEKALGPDHPSTLTMVNNIGNTYADQGRLGEAEAMYKRAPRGREKALGPEDTWTLNTVNELGSVYEAQGLLGDAEELYIRALRGREKVLGREKVDFHFPALHTIRNLALLHAELHNVAEGWD